MTLLSPFTALIAAALTVPVLVALYFLKLRRRPLAVPTTLLWQKSVQDLQVNTPFQRIRNSLLLWLQLLLLALLLIAMARPTREASVVPGDRVVIVIDRSASMNTADQPGGATRLEVAKEAALALVDDLGDAGGGGASEGSSGGAMVVGFAERAEVVQGFTSDRGRLRAAVRDLAATDQRSRIDAVWGLIEPHAAGAAAAGAGAGGLTVRVFSDLSLHRDDAAAELPAGVDVRAVAVGSATADNVGLVAAAARRDYERPERVAVFARLINAGPTPVETNVTLRVDGQVARAEPASLPAATPGGAPGEASVSFDVTLPGAADLTVSHDHVDALPADDAARLRLLPAERLRVLVVTEGEPYLAQSLRAAGARDVAVVGPEAYAAMPPQELRNGAAGDEGYGLVVFDRYRPSAVPPVSSLSFGSTVPVQGFEVREAAADAPEVQGVLTWRRDDRLMRYVQLEDVALRRPGRLVVPADATVLATGLGGPLLAEVTRDGLTHVATGFPLEDSRWPVHWSFQVFMVNALEVLGLSGQGDAGEGTLAYRTGQTATVPVTGRADGGTATFTGPARLSGTVRRGRAVLPAFPLVGEYTASGVTIEAPYDRLGVNLLDPLESDVRVGETLALGPGQGRAVAATTPEAARQEVWPWFAWAALGVLLLEWFVYTGRMRV